MKNPDTPWRVTRRPTAADTIDDSQGCILFVVVRGAAEQAQHAVELVNGAAGIQRALDRHDKQIANPKELADSVCLDGARSAT